MVWGVKKMKNKPQHCDSKVDERVSCEKKTTSDWQTVVFILRPCPDAPFNIRFLLIVETHNQMMTCHFNVCG